MDTDKSLKVLKHFHFMQLCICDTYECCSNLLQNLHCWFLMSFCKQFSVIELSFRCVLYMLTTALHVFTPAFRKVTFSDKVKVSHTNVCTVYYVYIPLYLCTFSVWMSIKHASVLDRWQNTYRVHSYGSNVINYLTWWIYTGTHVWDVQYVQVTLAAYTIFYVVFHINF